MTAGARLRRVRRGRALAGIAMAEGLLVTTKGREARMHRVRPRGRRLAA